MLVENQKLDAVIKLPSGVFKPYAGVSTAILCFTKTNSGGTDNVWFYDVAADGFSLDDKRNPVEANDLPDLLARWQSIRHSAASPVGAQSAESQQLIGEHARARADKSFFVPKADIVAQGYDLSINRYKEIIHDEVDYQPPLDIIAEIETLDTEIATALANLKTMLAINWEDISRLHPDQEYQDEFIAWDNADFS